MAAKLTLQEGAAADTPASGYGTTYVKTDGKLYFKDDAGTETDLTAGGGAGSDTTAIHDDTASEISAVTTKATPVSGDYILIEDSADSNNKKKITVGTLPTGGGGEANTASNVGTAGTGVYKQKTGVDIELYKLNSANNRLTVALDGTDKIDLTVVEGNIDHDALTNYAADEHFTQANITTVGTVTAGNVDAVVSSASTSVQGIITLAVASDVTSGGSTSLGVTPDALAGSSYGQQPMMAQVIEQDTALTTGDGKFSFFIPTRLNGWNLVDAQACVNTVSSSGTPTIQLYNVTQTADMLSTEITIDASEKTSYTAATPPVIDTDEDDVATGDEIRVDVDVAGTDTTGLQIHLLFQLP